MREIKFRFWNKEKKIMCYNDEDNSSTYWDGVCCSEVRIVNNTLNSEWTRKDYEIMEYTGIKDKNGKEIYEGDIVKYSDIYNGVVEYSEKYSQFILKETGVIADECEALGEFNMKLFEVIRQYI